jgi:hypothetical protein
VRGIAVRCVGRFFFWIKKAVLADLVRVYFKQLASHIKRRRKLPMAATSNKAVVITIEVDTGSVVDIQPINGAVISEFNQGDLTNIYKENGWYKTVAWIAHSHSSPGCLRLIGGSLVKVC